MIRCKTGGALLDHSRITHVHPAHHSYPVKGSNRAGGMETMARRMHIKIGQNVQPLMGRPFVEIPRHHSPGRPRNSLGNRAQLPDTMAADQAHMCRHQAKRGQVHTNGTARLQPRQRDMGHWTMGSTLAHQHRIAMPPQAHIIAGHRDHGKICLGSNQIAAQHRRAETQPTIHLLQGDHIGVQPIQHIQNTHRITAAIQPNGFADVVTGDTKAFIYIRHAPQMGLVRGGKKGQAMTKSTVFGQSRIVASMWGILLATAATALLFGRWEIGFVALATFGLAITPAILASRLDITLPVPFLVATTTFIFASVFMGEAFDFYERVWWWDMALHGTSAVGFGLIGFLFIFMLFDGDRYAAPPFALALIAFCVGMTVGAIWEVFEYLMDLWFGLNMQKSGLDDTMTDLMIDGLGAIIGATAGYIYLQGSNDHIFTRLIQQFVTLNKRFYQKLRKPGKD